METRRIGSLHVSIVGVLATKFGAGIGGLKGARPEYVRQAADESLRRLRTDRIDLYYLHVPDPDVPIADTLSALEDLVSAGKVREIACSNFSDCGRDVTGPGDGKCGRRRMASDGCRYGGGGCDCSFTCRCHQRSFVIERTRHA